MCLTLRRGGPRRAGPGGAVGGAGATATGPPPPARPARPGPGRAGRGLRDLAGTGRRAGGRHGLRPVGRRWSRSRRAALSRDAGPRRDVGLAAGVRRGRQGRAQGARRRGAAGRLVRDGVLRVQGGRRLARMTRMTRQSRVALLADRDAAGGFAVPSVSWLRSRTAGAARGTRPVGGRGRAGWRRNGVAAARATSGERRKPRAAHGDLVHRHRARRRPPPAGAAPASTRLRDPATAAARCRSARNRRSNVRRLMYELEEVGREYERRHRRRLHHGLVGPALRLRRRPARQAGAAARRRHSVNGCGPPVPCGAPGGPSSVSPPVRARGADRVRAAGPHVDAAPRPGRPTPPSPTSRYPLTVVTRPGPPRVGDARLPVPPVECPIDSSSSPPRAARRSSRSTIPCSWCHGGRPRGRTPPSRRESTPARPRHAHAPRPGLGGWTASDDQRVRRAPVNS
ncbi:hypothetical protein SGRIM128S_06797 [Streptomyces griseomycini]